MGSEEQIEEKQEQQTEQIVGSFDYLFKYIIVGYALVGKSNLLLRYVHDKFREEMVNTIGVEFGAKNVKIQGKTYRIQIWDTADQESFRNIIRPYFKNTACALVVYDITDRNSFNNVGDWIEEIKHLAPKTLLIVLVGNKSDLGFKREVKTEEGQELADKLGLIFYETSAKTGYNVENVFLKSAGEIAKRIENNFYDLENGKCGIREGIKRQNHLNQKLELDNNKDLDKDNNSYENSDSSSIKNNNKREDININELQIKEEKENNLKLKNENNQLKEEINILKQNNENIVKKIKEENNKLKEKIKSLEEEIKLKNKEQDFIMNKNTNMNQNVIISDKESEKIISVNFMTIGNQDIINYSMTCKTTDLFVKLEEKLYNDFPKYKNYETFFKVNSKLIKRFKSIEENNIKDNDIISLFIVEE